MNNDSLKAFVLRETIMRLLSDDEVARICTAETAEQLAEGEEYIDLERLQQGVRLAMGMPPVGRILSRCAVHETTWTRILAKLLTLQLAEGDYDECIETPRNT